MNSTVLIGFTNDEGCSALACLACGAAIYFARLVRGFKQAKVIAIMRRFI
jgi:hypothetical protein